MTASQRQANANTNALSKDIDYNRISEVRQQANRVTTNPEVDSLTNRLMTGLQTGHPAPPRL